MSHYFIDSSALIKRYYPESGTVWLRSITAQSVGNTIFIACIAPVEVVSGLSRRTREGYLLPAHAHAIRELLDRHIGRQYVTVGLDDGIVALAEDLLEKHPLRAYDAVQLASALEINARLLAARLSAPIFVSADARLLATAAAEGLATEDPSRHP